MPGPWASNMVATPTRVGGRGRVGVTPQADASGSGLLSFHGDAALDDVGNVGDQRGHNCERRPNFRITAPVPCRVRDCRAWRGASLLCLEPHRSVSAMRESRHGKRARCHLSLGAKAAGAARSPSRDRHTACATPTESLPPKTQETGVRSPKSAIGQLQASGKRPQVLAGCWEPAPSVSELPPPRTSPIED